MTPRSVPRTSAVRRQRHAAATALDSWQQRHTWSAIPVAVLARYDRDGGSRWAALLAYYGFLSLLPALLLLITGLGFLLAGNPALQQQVLSSALANVPVLGQQLRADVTSLNGSLTAVVIGVIGAAYGGGGVLRAAHDALDDIAAVPKAARSGRLLTNGRVLVVGAVMLVATLLTAVLAGAAASAQSAPVAGRLLSAVLTLLTGFAVLLMAFRMLPSRRPAWREVVPGGLAGAIGWTALHMMGGLFLGRVVGQASLTYGALAVVIGLLAWLYLQAQLFLLAAELNRVLAERSWPQSLRSC